MGSKLGNRWLRRFLIIWAVEVAWNAGFNLYLAIRVNNYSAFNSPLLFTIMMLTGGLLWVFIGSWIASITEKGCLTTILVVQCVFNLLTVSGRIKEIDNQRPSQAIETSQRTRFAADLDPSMNNDYFASNIVPLVPAWIFCIPMLFPVPLPVLILS